MPIGKELEPRPLPEMMALLLPLLLAESVPSAAAKANILHFMADDLGWNDLGHFNGGLTLTPHIDGLIATGVLLDRFHTFKVCAPSRASTMSGRYPFNVGFCKHFTSRRPIRAPAVSADRPPATALPLPPSLALCRRAADWAAAAHLRPLPCVSIRRDAEG